MKLNLVFGDSDLERVNLLQRGFESHPQLTACVLKPDELRALPSLHAFYLSITAAERWGSFVPRPTVHEARVLRTTAKDRADGWPPFVIAGIALRDGEEHFDAKFGLRLIIKAVIKAVRKFNEADDLIQSIGFESGWTGIDRLPPLEASQIICAAYDEGIT